MCGAYANFKVQPDAKNFFRPRLNFFNPPASCNPEIFLPVYLFTRTYLHLSLPTLYAYISIFISFYESFSCLNAPVLAVLIIVPFMNSSILIQRVF